MVYPENGPCALEKNICKVCPEGIQPCNMKNRDFYWRRYKIEETLHIGQWHLCPLQSRHLGISHNFPSISSTVQNNLQNPLLESPSATPLYFPKSHLGSKNLFPFKSGFSFGKSQKSQGTKSGLNHVGDLMFHQKSLHETRCMSRHIVVMKLPITSCP